MQLSLVHLFSSHVTNLTKQPSVTINTKRSATSQDPVSGIVLFVLLVSPKHRVGHLCRFARFGQETANRQIPWIRQQNPQLHK